MKRTYKQWEKTCAREHAAFDVCIVCGARAAVSKAPANKMYAAGKRNNRCAHCIEEMTMKRKGAAA